MRIITVLATLSLAACVAAPVDDAFLPSDEVAPPRLVLDVSDLAPGQPARATIDVGARNKQIYVAYSLTGPGAGPCPAVLSGRCLGVVSPALLGTARSDAAGIAILDFTVPAVWADQEVWFQAAKGTPGPVLSAVQSFVVHGQADLHLPWGPDAFRGYVFGTGPQAAPSPVDIWWNNLQLCAIASPLGVLASVEGAAYGDIAALPYAYDCYDVSEPGEAFALANADGTYAVVRAGDDYDTIYETSSVNHIGLDAIWPAPSSRWGQIELPTAAGERGWIEGSGPTFSFTNDIWWNNLQLCIDGARLGTAASADAIDLRGLAAMSPSYDCYNVADGGGEVFGYVTSTGERAALWVESFSLAYETPELNTITLQMSGVR